MHAQAPAAIRRFWLILWALGVGLSLMLLFATLRQRPFSVDALRHFPIDVLMRGRQFSREVRVVSTAEFLASLTTMLWLCFSESGARLMTRLEELGGRRHLTGLIAVASGVATLLAAVELPFSFYLGYFHEHAYGLTRQTAAGWLINYLLNTGLHLFLSLLLWLPIYWVMRRLPRHWWAPAAGLTITYTGAMVMLGPLVLVPMMGQVTPVRDPQITAMVERLAERAGVEVEQVQELEVSNRTSRVNAMVTGIFASRQILLFDTLLQQFRREEVEVVLAHELAHAAHGDIVTNWAVAGITDTVLLGLTAWMLIAMVEVRPLNLPAPHAPRGLALLLLANALFSNVAAPVQHFVTRQMEVRADRFALTATRNPAAFISGFRKLAGGNPGDVDPPWLVEMLDHSHPSIMNRIREAEAAQTKQSNGR